MADWERPFVRWEQWEQEFNEMFNRLTGKTARLWSQAGEEWVPPIDLSETEQAYVVQVELPGMEVDAISLTLEGRALLISGQKPHQRHCDGECYHRIERRFGPFQRLVHLPGEVDREHIAATSRHGVLTVWLPKVQETPPRPIEIDITARED